MKAIIFLIFLIQSLNCLGQTEKAILSYNKAGTKYFQNNDRLKTNKLKSILLSTPESKNYFGKYQTEKWAGIILFIPFLVSLSIVHNEQNPQFFFEKNSAFDLITTVTTSASIYFMAHQFKQLKKSARAYNKAKQLVLF